MQEDGGVEVPGRQEDEGVEVPGGQEDEGGLADAARRLLEVDSTIQFPDVRVPGPLPRGGQEQVQAAAEGGRRPGRHDEQGLHGRPLRPLRRP